MCRQWRVLPSYGVRGAGIASVEVVENERCELFLLTSTELLERHDEAPIGRGSARIRERALELGDLAFELLDALRFFAPHHTQHGVEI